MNRIPAIVGALLALVLVVAASTLAAPAERAGEHGRAPLADSSAAPEAQENDEDEPGGTPSDALLDRIVANLDDAGITTDADTVAALAADYGVGGAVRILAWADASGRGADEITALFDSGLGWGEIARQLNGEDDSLSLRPGIGWVMGNGGHAHEMGQGAGLGLGRAQAPGQQKKQP